MQTQLGLGGLTPGVASAPLRTSQAFARFNLEIRTGATELLEHIVRRPRRESDAWWSTLTSSYFAQESLPANRRTLPDTGAWRLLATLLRPCTRGLPLHRACRHRPCLLACRPRSSAPAWGLLDAALSSERSHGTSPPSDGYQQQRTTMIPHDDACRLQTPGRGGGRGDR